MTDQLALLKDLVVEYFNVLALDMSKLGLTDLVSHTINAGDNPPIWEPIRQIPFALHKKGRVSTEYDGTRGDTTF